MNDIALVALSAPEGIAIVKDGFDYRLVRPPYGAKDCPSVGEEAPGIAITQQGFSASDLTFSGWSSLITYLNHEVVSSRRAAGKDIPPQSVVTELIELAPGNVIDGYLDRIEQDLLTSRAFDQAEDLLISIARSKAVSEDWHRLTRTIDLLSVSKAARARFEGGIIRILDTNRSLGALREAGELARSEEIAARVRERGSLFAFC